MLHTLHLNGKFPSTKTSWDFEGVFDTIEPNWFCPEFFFVHRTSSGGAIYNSSKSKVQKVIKMKNEHHFYFKNFHAWSKKFLAWKKIEHWYLSFFISVITTRNYCRWRHRRMFYGQKEFWANPVMFNSVKNTFKVPGGFCWQKFSVQMKSEHKVEVP